MVIGNNNKGTLTEDGKLDQEDQRIKEVELGKWDELSENASIACGDWIHRIRPVICNLSKRARIYGTLVKKIVIQRCKDHLLLSPLEKLNKDLKDHEESPQRRVLKNKSHHK